MLQSITINMNIKQEFDRVVDIVKSNKSTDVELTDNDKLNMYKYYKQATVGNCNISKPWTIQFEACAKWDAWNSVFDMSQEQAMIAYINLYEFLSNLDKK